MNWEEIKAFNAGKGTKSYEVLGAIPMNQGFQFTVWAPNAAEVHVIGDFNNWEQGSGRMEAKGDSGIWSAHIPQAREQQKYKFAIRYRDGTEIFSKADPFARRQERAPGTASVIFRSSFEWTDGEWMHRRKQKQAVESPISIYEVHLGSWRKPGGEYPNYKKIASELADYVLRTGFTHVEFLPLTHHPFYGSWGYQCLGYFAPTELFGTPDDLKFLINHLHERGIGVILDWVPAHFPTDDQGLSSFDGSHLFEHSDPRKGFHPDWNTAIFNYGRQEVCSFLLSSARFWLEEYHIDGLRVDAVASMLYLDYSRNEGEWIPNEDGGNQNWEAVAFLRKFNESLYGAFPDILTIAEESTAWQGVSRPTFDGGLGFGFKWDMGWMNDTLKYLEKDPIHRKHHHGDLTFRCMYAFSENYVLALSHDEVVHGKGSLLNKMPGDEWQKRANLRLLFGLQFAQPGKKMLFMGMEFGQWKEWNHDEELDWELLDNPNHIGLLECVADLNSLYRSEKALHSLDTQPTGVEWSSMNDWESSILAFIRKGEDGSSIVATFNMRPNVVEYHRIGVPDAGNWKEVFNSDRERYGGGNITNEEETETERIPAHGQRHSIVIRLAPLAAQYWKIQEPK